VSEREIHVDRAKIEVIEQLPNPINIRGICSFLGHRGGATGYARYALAYLADPACIRVYIFYLKKTKTKEHLPVGLRTENERNASSPCSFAAFL
jgi:hypothetical protein